MERKVKEIVVGIQTHDGAGVALRRVLSNRTTKEFDPFLMLDFFDSKNPEDYIKGFPWHPHRGIETITYLISGEIEHGDSMGNKGVIHGGECQWMTAGSGIIHQEMPIASDHMLGAQLWLNLPKQDKMAPPAYHSITAEQIPEVQGNGAVVKVISGEYGGEKAYMQGDYVRATYLDVQLEGGAEWTLETPKNDTLFIYIISGDAFLGKQSKELTGAVRAVLFSHGEHVTIVGGQKGVRFLLAYAPPLKEPIAWGGPIVMNTKEELDQAFFELDHNTFIKHNK